MLDDVVPRKDLKERLAITIRLLRAGARVRASGEEATRAAAL